MKDPIQLRAHVLAAIPDLIGTRSYGSTTEQAISIIPDPQYSDGGMSAPDVIDGYPVIYAGIEIVIYDSPSANISPMLANEAKLDNDTWILIKDWGTSENNKIVEAAHRIGKGLDVKETMLPEGKPDQAPLLKSIILLISYSAY